MTTEVIVAVITTVGVIVTAVLTKVGFSKELDKKVAVIEVRIDSLEKKVDEHNGYAKLFSSSLPAISTKLEMLEKKLG